ncbi:hypothetical protein PWG14_13435 (plasmid) [Chromobacterium amazonense]|uniref:hypothetical protein n=1 Tax=Chromobacterium amazonense TaxID=1382803 RepID=UPI00237E41FD|nr:hypothetical protein [Chromobacterium amazonense]MDE1713571.1 hypothetical protein [Chromobacterium amazonense]
MTEQARLRNFKRYLRVVFKAARRNLIATASILALSFGGLTLLLYACSIGQLPEFSWNDLTGTLLAACITGLMVLGIFVVYCLFAGYFARSSLEWVYPEAANYSPQPVTANSPSEIAPYTQLMRPSFIIGTTLFSVLSWSLLITIIASEQLVSPYREQLYGSLIAAMLAVATLILIDWKRFTSQFVRHGLVGILVSATAIVITIIVAWSEGPSSLAAKIKNPPNAPAVTVNYSECWVELIDHAIAIGVSFLFLSVLVLNIKKIASCTKKTVQNIAHRIPWKLPKWLVVNINKVIYTIGGDASGRKLLLAKACSMVVFFASSSIALLTAFLMAGMGSKDDWGRNFVLITAILIALNFVSFAIRKWRDRVILGSITAGLVFISYPIFIHNSLMFPKMIVSLLGLGNERLEVIGISSKQCATLASYGVSCSAGGDQTITLINVNLLNRLGSTAVLELLVKEEVTGKSKLIAKEGVKASSLLLPALKEKNALERQILTTKTAEMTPSKCDELLLSQIDAGSSTTRESLRCKVLVLPKDQIAGYTKSGTRSYNGNYTSYLPNLNKKPIP